MSGTNNLKVTGRIGTTTMHKHLLVIQLMGRWWRIEVGQTIRPSIPMSAGPDIPLSLMQVCNVVYDVTTKTMIKNRHGPDEQLDDAIILRLWLEDDLPTFEYNGYNDLQQQFSDWCVTVAA